MYKMKKTKNEGKIKKSKTGKSKNMKIRKTKKVKKTKKTRKYTGGNSYYSLIKVVNQPYSYNVVVEQIKDDVIYEEINGLYTGPWKYNQPYMRGKMDVLENNNTNTIKGTYDGPWRNGKPDGHNCKYTTASGNIYEGEYKDGLIHGEGKFTYANGRKYVGEFKNGFMEGKGTDTYTNGSRYEGDFIRNDKHGYGILEYYNGSRYEGQWANNKKNGIGTFKSPDDIYNGSWLNDKPHGYGILTRNDGSSRYEGQWVNSKKNGIGTFESNDEKYTGNWVNDIPVGDGNIEFKKTKVILKGNFSYDRENNVIVEGMAKFPDDSTYEGKFINYLKYGEGIATPPNTGLASDSEYHIVDGFIEEPDSVTAENLSYYDNILPHLRLP